MMAAPAVSSTTSMTRLISVLLFNTLKQPYDAKLKPSTGHDRTPVGDMIKKKTVFVLGAGASEPYGFPSGERLTDQICRELRNPGAPAPLAKFIIGTKFSESAVRDFADRLDKAGRLSIDEFLQGHPKDKDLAKLAIARVLVPLENDTLINPRAPLPAGQIDRRWYRDFFDRLLTSSSGRCSIKANNLSVVTFNLDRSFERALFLFAQANCAADGAPGRIAQEVPIYHVHGRIGAPAWLLDVGVQPSDAEPPRDYKYDLNGDDTLRRCADFIRIVDDEVVGSEAVTNARVALVELTKCVGWVRLSPLNLENFRSGRLRGGCKILGTA